MRTRIDLQEQLREGAVGRGDPAAGLGERVRAHLAGPLERVRALLADARAGDAGDSHAEALAAATEALVAGIDDLDGAFDGMGGSGPGPRLTLALASELSFIARHLESPLPPPTVERLQPRVRRAARLATLWLSPHDFNATTTLGPEASASAAWRSGAVDETPEVDAQRPAPPPTAAVPTAAAPPASAQPSATPPSPAPSASDPNSMAAQAARDVIRSRMDELRAERRTAEERLELLDRYWRFATHELRNAAHSLVMVVEQLETGALSSAPWLAPLGRASRAVLARSQEALDDENIARGMFAVEPEQLDLVEVSFAALEEARPVAEQTGIRLVAERLPVGQPIWAHADPQRVQQILHNLLRNALEVTPAGGFVMVETAIMDSHAAVIITDSGPGLDPADAEELLLSGKRPGGRRPGLGLPICRHLARAMGGNVRLMEAAPGVGARFLLSLPRAHP